MNGFVPTRLYDSSERMSLTLAVSLHVHSEPGLTLGSTQCRDVGWH